ncbi:hypothetical protein [Corynebacterium oculi]|uniref:Uncharacterized protein n=1 Tax=Corynebacterium oculi TaxID=1544416 RepID=A0A0Q0UFC4_9CORY|nr:hypothetical protein [Corynebacterium oculi]KQB85416.1 hypothetical protein Cocul_00555 [Corynebacterium oculi]
MLVRGDGTGGGTRPRRRLSDQITTYVVGGVFGLSVVLGAVFLTDESTDPAVPAGTDIHAGAAATAR